MAGIQLVGLTGLTPLLKVGKPLSSKLDVELTPRERRIRGSIALPKITLKHALRLPNLCFTITLKLLYV